MTDRYIKGLLDNVNDDGILEYTPSGTGATATTVEDILDAQLMVDYVALRAYTGLAKTVRVTGLLTTAQPQGIAGFFQYDGTDVTSADNGGTIIVGTDGRRWKRVFNGAVDVQWFEGVIGNGANDDRAGIQKALNTQLSVEFTKPLVSYFMSDSVNLFSNQSVFSTKSSLIQIPNGSVNAFLLDGINGASVKGLRISSKALTNSTGLKAMVFVSNCRNIEIENNLIFNFGHAGVLMFDSSSCKIANNTFGDSFAVNQDSGDIIVYNDSNFNFIANNFCYGKGSDHGIMVQDQSGFTKPTGNKIVNNDVGEHKTDGILVYVKNSFNTKTIVSGNSIRDILGTGLGGLSGHGIYIQSAGGAVVSNNTVVNCCRQTTGFETQLVAHIGVAIGDLSVYPGGKFTPVLVVNNNIDAPRGPGIYAATSDAPVLIKNNSVVCSSIEAVRGEAIRAINVQGVVIKDNSVQHINNNYSAISVLASAVNVLDVEVSSNDILGTANGFQFAGISGGVINGAIFSNNTTNRLTSQSVSISETNNLKMFGNEIKSSAIALVAQNCLRAKYSLNTFDSTSGGSGLIFAGTNTGSVFDESNQISCVVENNTSNGTIISQFADSVPPYSGLSDVGDRVIKRTSIIGQPKGWRCTTAGNPGVFTSEGNL